MKKFLARALLGLLPFWVAILIVYLGGTDPEKNSQYWTVAPWLIILSIPASAIWFAITTKAAVVYDASTGSASSRIARSFLSLTKSIFLLLIVASILFAYSRINAHLLDREKTHAIAFAQRNSDIVALAGPSANISLSTLTMKSHWRGAVYYFHVRGAKTFYAIVRSAPKLTGTTFILACVTQLSPGQQESFKDPCAKSTDADRSNWPLRKESGTRL